MIQSELKVKIKEAKEKYGRKLEWKLKQNNLREVWSGIRTITGFRTTNSRGVEGRVDRANELNLFFNRFDTSGLTHPPSDSSAVCPGRPPSTIPYSPPPPSPPSYTPPSSCVSPLHTSSDCQTDFTPLHYTPPPPVTSTVCFTADQVRRQLMRLHSNKAPGPDGVSPRVLEACALQLCGVLHHVFNMSLSLQRVPMLWKTSCLVPVPKTSQPRASKDYRPVALTSHIMKTLEFWSSSGPWSSHSWTPFSSPITPDFNHDCSTMSMPTWTSRRTL
ncbi:uncharacterized protein LOC143334815 [Chaetodon auriga]|uniref:uncharacterized protein LOC143334815 n=1 Tax=Chaetodon auriga TaxID=39042 RepID=UPI0040330006